MLRATLSAKKVVATLCLQLLLIGGHLLFYPNHYSASFCSTVPGKASPLIQITLFSLTYIIFLNFQDIAINHSKAFILIRLKNYKQWLSALLFMTFIIAVGYWSSYLLLAMTIKRIGFSTNIGWGWLFGVLSATLISELYQFLQRILQAKPTSLALVIFAVIAYTYFRIKTNSQITNFLSPVQIILPTHASLQILILLLTITIIKIIAMFLLIEKLFIER